MDLIGRRKIDITVEDSAGNFMNYGPTLAIYKGSETVLIDESMGRKN